MHFKEINEEVLYPMGDLVEIRHADIELLKKMALHTKRKRIRFCSHMNLNDILQEMFIVHTRETYVRPHKHLSKVEAFHVIEGEADVLFFDDAGKITDHYELGDYGSGKQFYCRIPEPVFHSFIINSDIIVFHEITHGPFVRSETVFPAWSPIEENADRVDDYIKQMRKEVENMRQRRSLPIND